MKARAFLQKDLPNGRRGHEEDNILTNIKSYQIAIKTAVFLQEMGFKAKPIFPNFKYREDVPGWEVNMIPELSLKLIAIRSGTGSLGFSGNVGLKGYGALIILGGVVTSAKLTPTDPIPNEDSFCIECKLCQKVCALRMFGSDEVDSMTIGGYTFNCAKRVNLARCQIVCGGLSGLDKSRKWSTWSPGRYPFPETDKEVMKLLAISINNALKWPETGDEIGVDVTELDDYDSFLNALGDDKEKLVQMIKETKLTCGNCQLICWGDPKETAENYRILTNSGCVLQKENGEIIVLPPEDADKLFSKMPLKHQKLYYKEFGRKSKK
ncbi:MAG: hypothetical protein EU533_07660 [Promethearchaeota archaeon]|nr:MAG: hypothetical protein EU533_07660 [Candidatus Lokiarchaeota archaeon]